MDVPVNVDKLDRLYIIICVWRSVERIHRLRVVKVLFHRVYVSGSLGNNRQWFLDVAIVSVANDHPTGGRDVISDFGDGSRYVWICIDDDAGWSNRSRLRFVVLSFCGRSGSEAALLTTFHRSFDHLVTCATCLFQLQTSLNYDNRTIISNNRKVTSL